MLEKEARKQHGERAQSSCDGETAVKGPCTRGLMAIKEKPETTHSLDEVSHRENEFG